MFQEKTQGRFFVKMANEELTREVNLLDVLLLLRFYATADFMKDQLTGPLH